MQAQAIPDGNPRIPRVARDAVCGSGVDGAGGFALRLRVHEEVEIVSDVEVAELEGSAQSDDQGSV